MSIYKIGWGVGVGGGGGEPTAWPPSAGSSKRTRKNTLNYKFFLEFRSLSLYFYYLLCLKHTGKIASLDKAITVEDIGYERGRRPSEFSLNMRIQLERPDRQTATLFIVLYVLNHTTD